jgi:tritrans,polycis-undecaprenyl-diphosphate synthase [geranylgeranyl-diphosphate specific]
MAFVRFAIRANYSERQKIIAWLQKLHRPIPIIDLETNLMIFATIAYGLVRTHEFLGGMTPDRLNALTTSVMSMADKIDPEDKGRKRLSTISDVEEYLRNEFGMDPKKALDIFRVHTKLQNIQTEIRTLGFWRVLRKPFTTIQMLLFIAYVRRLSRNVLLQPYEDSGIIERLVWWCVRKIHCCISYFHSTICPEILSLDGSLQLMGTVIPNMESVVLEMHQEIFGKGDSPQSRQLPNKATQKPSELEAHLPRMKADTRAKSNVPGFPQQFIELIKCSYYRGILERGAAHPPQHLGIIMDGNRRYSRRQGLDSVLDGHRAGRHKLFEVLSWSFSSGVRNLTVWALSNDNLKRGPEELGSLFCLIADCTSNELARELWNVIPDIRFRVVGDRSILPSYLNEWIVNMEAATEQNTAFNFQLALGYGGRLEVIHAMKLALNDKVEHDGMALEQAVKKISEADISNNIYSARLGLPPIDAIMRTSGENRLSGFALWESHYAEFVIVDEYWPALKQSTFLCKLLELSKRNRRFGA